MRSLGGRPHWSKPHGLRAAELRDAYPRWDDFLAGQSLPLSFLARGLAPGCLRLFSYLAPQRRPFHCLHVVPS